MNVCNQCPNNCGINREQGIGRCLVSNELKIAKFSLHPFEEPPISGEQGSGTIFFCGCSLKCVFCQNFEVSRNVVGKTISVSELADVFRKLEEMGANNVNLVNPTHYSQQIIEALNLYRPSVPIVWNTHGYESIETLEKIDEYVDVYLTDLKYYSEKVSERYTKISNYFKVAIKALDFMMNKKTVIENGLMKKGVIVRHLILPLNTSDSIDLLTILRQHVKNGAYLSLMSQYTPFGEIENFPELKRKITAREYKKVYDKVVELNFENVFAQDSKSSDVSYIPNWDF